MAWELWEHKNKFEQWMKSPNVKIFNDLAEARQGLIAYMKNPDVKDYEFKLREVEGGVVSETVEGTSDGEKECKTFQRKGQ